MAKGKQQQQNKDAAGLIGIPMSSFVSMTPEPWVSYDKLVALLELFAGTDQHVVVSIEREAQIDGVRTALITRMGLAHVAKVVPQDSGSFQIYFEWAGGQTTVHSMESCTGELIDWYVGDFACMRTVHVTIRD